MTFNEHNLTFQSRPESVHAVRVSERGLIVAPGISLAWIDRLIAEKRLQRGETQWFVKPQELRTIAVYPGDWIVEYDATRHLMVMSDEVFRRRFEDRVEEKA